MGWGAPHYFHPDERNIAGSISRMYWEKTLNPQFFAYGSFWSYIVLFILRLFSFFPHFSDLPYFPYDPFIRAIILLRLFSALQGIGLIVISYLIAKQIISRQSAVGSRQKNNTCFLQTADCKLLTLLLPFMVAASPGLIQASHFGTFEQSLAFLYALIFYLALKFLETRKFIIWFLICVAFGVSVSVRVTSIILLPIIFSVLFLSVFRETRSSASLQKNKKIAISLISLISLLSLFLIPLAIFSLSNPFSFRLPQQWNHEAMKQWFFSPFSHDFLSTMRYESEVALGTMPVFYTGQFNETTPIIYQFLRVLPFVLNPVIWLLFICSLIIPLISLIIHLSAKIRLKSMPRAEPQAKWGAKIQAPNISISLTLLFFAVTFIPNSTIFVKWIRYVIPSLPFIYILVFLFLFRLLRPPLLFLISLTSLLFSLFFVSVYSFDTRITAASWAGKNLKPDVKILSEVYDMGIVPFNEVFHYSQIKLFNFYEMDDVFGDAENLAELKNSLNQFDVIVLPSRRIADARLRLPKLYPNGNWFYKNLFAGNLGFRLVKTFSHPYDKILPILTPDESFTVFDHPEVEIFVRQKFPS